MILVKRAIVALLFVGILGDVLGSDCSENSGGSITERVNLGFVSGSEEVTYIPNLDNAQSVEVHADRRYRDDTITTTVEAQQGYWHSNSMLDTRYVCSTSTTSGSEETERVLVESKTVNTPSNLSSPHDIAQEILQANDLVSNGISAVEDTAGIHAESEISDSNEDIDAEAKEALSESEMRAAEAQAAADRHGVEHITIPKGDPVKLATGALSIRDLDLSIVLPGRAENLSVMRDYDSRRREVGFFGLGWSAELEGRILFGRDYPYWVNESILEAEVAQFQTRIREVEETWIEERNSIDNAMSQLRGRIDMTQRTIHGYGSLRYSTSFVPLSNVYNRFVDRFSELLNRLEQGLTRLSNRKTVVENHYNNSIADFNTRINVLNEQLAESRRLRMENDAIRDKNLERIFPGQSPNTDLLGRDRVVVFFPFGGARVYTINEGLSSPSSTVYTSEQYPLDSLIVEDGVARLMEPGGFATHFDAQGRFAHRYVNDLLLYSLVYDSSQDIPGPVGISVYGDRYIGIEWTSDSTPKIARLVYKGENLRKYEYEGEYLRSIWYPNGMEYRYGYGNTHAGYKQLDMLEVFSNEDSSTAEYMGNYEYDSYGRVILAQNNRGLNERFGYTLRGDRIWLASYTDSDGIIRHFTYNERLEEIRVESPVEVDREIERDDFGRVLSTHRLEYGGRSRYEYSDIGVLTKILGPIGGQQILGYNEGGWMTSQQDFNGNTTRYEYGDWGNIKKIIHPDGSTEEFVYNSHNLCTLYRDEEGWEWEYEYNNFGYLTKITDPLGHSVEISYNDFGQVISQKSPLGEMQTYEYDPRYWKTAEVDSQERRREFNGFGEQVSGEADYFDASGIVLLPIAQRMENVTHENFPGEILKYNRLGLPIEIRWTDGGLWKYSYNYAGRLTESEDPEGNTTQYRYTARGWLSKIMYPNGISLERFYDRRGNIIEERIPNDRASRIRTLYKYDPNSNVSEIQFEDGSRTVYERDADGRVLKITEGITPESPKGLRERRYEYDIHGNVTQIHNGQTAIFAYNYDNNGRIQRIENAIGLITNFDYSNGNQRSWDNLGRERLFEFDGLGRMISQTNPAGDMVQYEYTRSGVNIITPQGDSVLVSYSDGWKRRENIFEEGNNEVLVYNDRREIIEERLGDKWRRFGYDQQSNPIREESSDGRRSTYEYDEVNRVIREEHRNTGSENYWVEYSYTDGDYILGNGASRKSTDSLGNTITTHYAERGKESYIENEDGEVISRYNYDALGRLIVAETPSIRQEFTWDAQNRLRSSWDSLSDVLHEYRYDLVGNLTSLKDSLGFEREMEYSRASEQTGLTVGSNSNESEGLRISRDAVGRAVALVVADDVFSTDSLKQTIAYNANGMQKMNKVVSEGIQFSELYVYDGNNRREHSVDQSGGVYSYSYNNKAEVARIQRPIRSVPVNGIRVNQGGRNLFENRSEWKTMDREQESELQKMWRQANLPGSFFGSQPGENLVVNADRLNSDVANLRLDSKGNVVGWIDSAGEYTLNYDIFGRVSRLSIAGALERSSCDYNYDALHRLVLEECVFGTVRSGERIVKIMYVHIGIAHAPVVQIEYEENSVDRSGEVNFRSNNAGGTLLGTGSTHEGRSIAERRDTALISENGTELRLSRSVCGSLSLRGWTDRYRHSSGSRLYSSGGSSRSLERGITPVFVAFACKNAERVIWYSYRDREIQVASILKQGEGLQNYVLFADARMDLRVLGNMDSHATSLGTAKAEGITELSYDIFGNPRNTVSSEDFSHVFPGFALALHNSITGISNFGYRFYAPKLKRFLSTDPLRSDFSWTAYSDNDPVNYRDRLGLKKQASLYFNKEDNKLVGIVYDDENPDAEIQVIDFAAYSNVTKRTEPLFNNGNIIKTIPLRGEEAQPYIPLSFPEGSFDITAINRYEEYEGQREELLEQAAALADSPEEYESAAREINNIRTYNEYIGATSLVTNATQEVEVFEQAENGTWQVKKVDENSDEIVTATDIGYSIHGGGSTRDGGYHPMGKNRPQDTTIGCVRVENQIINILAEYVEDVFEDGGRVTICAY